MQDCAVLYLRQSNILTKLPASDGIQIQAILVWERPRANTILKRNVAFENYGNGSQGCVLSSRQRLFTICIECHSNQAVSDEQ